ncbi:hypothetical protein BDY19DRAFT_903532 [Irpex rosettiformis]|uniref:Uncharacterized protein n=1 Tax=Irpex rosettiformis TaxID=378272 RepID=A0ACB8UEV0_9APHY|nr:hypothetical protein BDY19DRAFT_903532 [Irpex rosettiformis]
MKPWLLSTAAPNAHKYPVKPYEAFTKKHILHGVGLRLSIPYLCLLCSVGHEVTAIPEGNVRICHAPPQPPPPARVSRRYTTTSLLFFVNNNHGMSINYISSYAKAQLYWIVRLKYWGLMCPVSSSFAFYFEIDVGRKVEAFEVVTVWLRLRRRSFNGELNEYMARMLGIVSFASWTVSDIYDFNLRLPRSSLTVLIFTSQALISNGADYNAMDGLSEASYDLFDMPNIRLRIENFGRREVQRVIRISDNIRSQQSRVWTSRVLYLRKWDELTEMKILSAKYRVRVMDSSRPRLQSGTTNMHEILIVARAHGTATQGSQKASTSFPPPANNVGTSAHTVPP